MNINKIGEQSYVDVARYREGVAANHEAAAGTQIQAGGAAQQAVEYVGVQDVSQHSEKIADDMLRKSLEQANKNLAKADRYIEREIHEKTKAVMYKLMDRKTGEVIAEFPPKKIQDMIAKMWEAAGMFVDKKA